MFRLRKDFHHLVELLKRRICWFYYIKTVPYLLTENIANFFSLYVIPILAFNFLVGVQVWDQRYQATCSYPGRHADAGGSGLAAPRLWMNVWIWRGGGVGIRDRGEQCCGPGSPRNWNYYVQYRTVPVYQYLSMSFVIWIRNNFYRKVFPNLMWTKVPVFQNIFLAIIDRYRYLLLRVTFTLTHTNTYLHLQVITTFTPIPTHIGTSLKPTLHLRGTHTATPTPNTYTFTYT